MIDIKDKIMKMVRGYGHGNWVFSARDFLGLGRRASVDQGLSRLCKQGQIRRIKRGLYDYPKWSKLLNDYAPTDGQVIMDAILRQKPTMRILSSGIDAANSLGLTNAVPSKTVFYTDGANQILNIGSRTIQFKHATPIRMIWSDRPGGRVVQALNWLGNDVASKDKIISQLRNQLPSKIKQDLSDGIQLLPAWMIPVVQSIAAGDVQ